MTDTHEHGISGKTEKKEDTTDGQVNTSKRFPLLDPSVGLGSKCLLVCKTAALVNVWINMGLAATIISVTIPDMLPRIGANYETITQAGSFGPLISILGFAVAMICDKFSKWQDIVMSASLLLTSGTCVLFPWTRSLLEYGITNVFFFCGFALQNAIGNYMIANLWGAHASGPMHFMHVGFGIGAFICPLVARSFLSPDATDGVANGTGNVTAYTHQLQSENEFESQIEIPYAILGGYGSFCALTFVVLQLVGPPKTIALASERTDSLISNQKNCMSFFSPGNWADGDIPFGVIMLVGMTSYYVGLNGNEGPVRYFLFSFAIESELKFSKQDAALLDSLFNLFYTLGRLLVGVISLCVPIQILVFISLTLVVASTACLSFALPTQIHLWIFACVYGFTTGPNWPSGLSWANRYITITASFSAWIGIFPVLFKFGFDWLIGHLFQKSPYYVMYFSLAFALFVLVSMVMLQMFASRHGSRHGPDSKAAKKKKYELRKKSVSPHQTPETVF